LRIFKTINCHYIITKAIVKKILGVLWDGKGRREPRPTAFVAGKRDKQGQAGQVSNKKHQTPKVKVRLLRPVGLAMTPHQRSSVRGKPFDTSMLLSVNKLRVNRTGS